ncbi:hypothetical protein M407DRAFT_208645 [Tulasnella calospora MUT 4182]|uniref:Uncharacterized protein n=1 Tax=Tulasnella calospora MUT 4182 TaxID=1051891 RepID=A0A0C3KW07_9AGAM|nr:hypothetical protein M407DRAFT_208645 [Tulasnella calospora MUT 4182]
MSTPTYLSDHDGECVPDPYSLLDSEPPSPNFTNPPATPVSTHLFVPSSLAPSILGISPPLITYQPPTSPSSSRSNSSSESSDAFENFGAAPSSVIYSSHASSHSPFDYEFGRAQRNVGRSSPLSTAATSLTSSQDQIQLLPVSLPISDPRWVQILAGHSPNGSGVIDEFARTVTEDSRRVEYLREVKASREHNRLADLYHEPLTPIPNISGLTMPLGYHHPITSVSQIYDMPLTELDGWLLHYDIRTAPELNAEGMKQRTLAQHVGVVVPDDDLSHDYVAGSISFGRPASFGV